MFKKLFFMLALLSTLVQAQTNCPGDLCVGQIVIDSNNYVGIVVGHANGQVLYRRNGNNYENTSSSSGLSKKIIKESMADGTFLIDENNYVGEVKNVFADGRVEYRREGNNYNNVSRNVSREIKELAGVKKDAFVIDESNYVGKTKRVFENGKVQYTREGNNYTNISNSVSVEISGANNIASGVKVIDENNYVGVAKRVFANGKTQYQRNGNNYTNISSSVVAETPELGNINAGKNVLDGNNYSGVAQNVFRDGRVEYRRDGNNYNNISNSLVYEVPNLANGTKTGTVVLDSNNYVGTTKIVYSDERVLYQRNGNTYNNVGKDLSYEVDENENYQKGKEYASPNHTIGEVIHFFSNGKIELSGDNYSTICDKLAEEANDVDGVSVGTEVIMPLQLVKVEKIFSNSTARIVLNEKPMSIHVLSKDEIKEEGIRYMWLLELNQKLQNQSGFENRKAVKKESYREFLELLIKDLENGRRFNRRDLERLQKHLGEELQKLPQN